MLGAEAGRSSMSRYTKTEFVRGKKEGKKSLCSSFVRSICRVRGLARRYRCYTYSLGSLKQNTCQRKHQQVTILVGQENSFQMTWLQILLFKKWHLSVLLAERLDLGIGSPVTVFLWQTNWFFFLVWPHVSYCFTTTYINTNWFLESSDRSHLWATSVYKYKS